MNNFESSRVSGILKLFWLPYWSIDSNNLLSFYANCHGFHVHSSGHLKTPQPDNAEEDINGSKESCLGLLNNIYEDGIKWHDIACYHPKPFMCEDSDALLEYVAATNEGIVL